MTTQELPGFKLAGVSLDHADEAGEAPHLQVLLGQDVTKERADRVDVVRLAERQDELELALQPGWRRVPFVVRITLPPLL
jgi:hypothetical protein